MVMDYCWRLSCLRPAASCLCLLNPPLPSFMFNISFFLLYLLSPAAPALSAPTPPSITFCILDADFFLATISLNSLAFRFCLDYDSLAISVASSYDESPTRDSDDFAEFESDADASMNGAGDAEGRGPPVVNKRISTKYYKEF